VARWIQSAPESYSAVERTRIERALAGLSRKDSGEVPDMGDPGNFGELY
jgi:hypothetical protein